MRRLECAGARRVRLTAFARAPLRGLDLARQTRCSEARRAGFRLGEQLPDPPGDLPASGANFLDPATVRIVELLIDAALARNERALITAPHAHARVGLLGEVGGEQLPLGAGEVDPELAHHLDHLRLEGRWRAHGLSRLGRPPRTRTEDADQVCAESERDGLYKHTSRIFTDNEPGPRRATRRRVRRDWHTTPPRQVRRQWKDCVLVAPSRRRGQLTQAHRTRTRYGVLPGPGLGEVAFCGGGGVAFSARGFASALGGRCPSSSLSRFCALGARCPKLSRFLSAIVAYPAFLGVPWLFLGGGGVPWLFGATVFGGL